jgi:hypothetical protein
LAEDARTPAKVCAFVLFKLGKASSVRNWVESGTYHLLKTPGSDDPSRMDEAVQKSSLDIERAAKLVLDIVIYKKLERYSRL